MAAIDILNDVVIGVGYVLGWTPWVVLFFCAWKRSILPFAWADELLGEKDSSPGIRGKLKYVMFPGGLSLYMNLLLWGTIVPPQVLQWDSFPKFCVLPRHWTGLLHVNQACWHHANFMHYGSNNLYLWTLGPLVLSYNRRTFVFSLFFIGILGNFVLWLVGPDNTCILGFSTVIFGWFGMLTIALPLECPPRWWRLVLLLIVGFFLGTSFYKEVFGGDDQEGISWHAHVIGFAHGIVFGYLRFRRGWFQRDGFEDRIRPLGEKMSFLDLVSRLGSELVYSVMDSAVDVANICCCKGPGPRPSGAPETSGASHMPPPQMFGESESGTPAGKPSGSI
eukprot:TRINITY_DN40059_c0_g1_i1.p1 TRINITY_DN40059_c0_g1~~TRINITY_DN40059_c0_g1_i1.p1  ORF type:complete len:335 (-),score=47.60 TRINITY_DN40059_c0_g1_i1:549-1553(-)